MNLELFKKIDLKKKKKFTGFFNDLYDLMNSPIFKKFYNKYCNNWDDINTTIMYFKTYETLDYLFYSTYNRKIKKFEMIFLLQKIFKNKFSRKIAINKFNLYKNTCDKYLNFNNLLNN